MNYSYKLFNMAVESSIEKGAISARQVAREIGCTESRVIRHVQDNIGLRAKLGKNRRDRNNAMAKSLISRVETWKSLGFNTSQACKELGIKRHDYYRAYNYLG